jgi:phage/plasmid-like protein (TIGR03299 family)
VRNPAHPTKEEKIMGLIPEQSFTVRNPAWWDRDGDYDLQEYPGRELAMELAGHAWDVAERPVAHLRRNADGQLAWRKLDGYVEHFRSDNGFTLRVGADSFERIPNHVPYDVAEVLLDEGFLFETGGTLDGGKQCYLTLLLNEPVVITGDTSITLPYAGLSWAHDGSASFSIRSTSVRQVCENTVSASEAEGRKLGTNYVFRHTKNVMERIEEAKKTIQGVRANHDVYVQAMEALAAIPVTPEQRDLFVSTIIGDVQPSGLPLSQRPDTTSRVKTNIENERTKVLGLFMGQTIPEAHALTGYGLHLAGVEYFDHLRAYRSKDSYVRRTLLTDNPAKASLTRTIRELVAA